MNALEIPTDQWVYVSSSWVYAWRYNEKKEELTLWFNSNFRATYPNVRAPMVLSLMSAPSVGQWVNQNLASVGWPYR